MPRKPQVAATPAKSFDLDVSVQEVGHVRAPSDDRTDAEKLTEVINEFKESEDSGDAQTLAPLEPIERVQMKAKPKRAPRTKKEPVAEALADIEPATANINEVVAEVRARRQKDGKRAPGGSEKSELP